MSDLSRDESAASDPIEQRLRADATAARGSERPAELEPLLERALSGPPRRSHRRGTWLAAAAVLALAAAGASVAVTRGPSGDAAGGGRWRTMTNAGFSGAVLDASDPSRLYLLVEHGDGDGPCDVRDPRATVTAQSSTSVTVAVSGQMRLPASAPATGPFGFTCSVTGYLQVGVQLDAPLGRRKLFDGSDPRPQPVLDPSTVPTPSAVPPGYTAEPVTWEPDYVAEVPPGGKPPDANAGWPALRRYRHGYDVLDVRTGRPALFTAATSNARAPVVAGHVAAVSGYDGTVCLTWTETPERAIQVCSTAGSRPAAGASAEVTQPTAAPLSEQQLLQVARSLS